jgi:hypothetical protein
MAKWIMWSTQTASRDAEVGRDVHPNSNRDHRSRHVPDLVWRRLSHEETPSGLTTSPALSGGRSCRRRKRVPHRPVWIGPSRLDHRLATFFGPDLGKVTKEASRERLASTNGTTVQITRLAGFPFLTSVMFDTCFHLIIFTLAGGCAGNSMTCWD